MPANLNPENHRNCRNQASAKNARKKCAEKWEIVGGKWQWKTQRKDELLQIIQLQLFGRHSAFVRAVKVDDLKGSPSKSRWKI